MYKEMLFGGKASLILFFPQKQKRYFQEVAIALFLFKTPARYNLSRVYER